MNTFRIAFLIASFVAVPLPALADPAPPPAESATRDARLVPVLRDGTPVGLKVYAIRAGGRFDQLKFENGDTIEKIDDEPVTTDAGGKALRDKVIDGTADATVTVVRKGARVKLASKAVER